MNKSLKFREDFIPLIINGSKTQTRRPIKIIDRNREYEIDNINNRGLVECRCTNCKIHFEQLLKYFIEDFSPYQIKSNPSFHTISSDKEDSLVIEITDIKVERLYDISDSDAKKEGLTPHLMGKYKNFVDPSKGFGKDNYEWNGRELSAIQISYITLWESLYGMESARANPWVWVYDFRAYCFTDGQDHICRLANSHIDTNGDTRDSYLAHGDKEDDNYCA